MNPNCFREQSPTYQIGITGMISKKAFQNELKNANIDLTPEQVGILNLLLEKDHITMQEISDKNNRDNSATTRIINVLERKGYAERKNSPTDRRAYLIAITPTGKEEVIKANTVGRAYVQKALANIAPADLDIFMKVIKSIRQNISNLI